MDCDALLRDEVRKLSKLLQTRKERLVLAESCTGGLLASHFTETPGVSDRFCGSLVVYRPASKEQWLGVKHRTLRNHTPVSRETAEEMARGALRKTKEATIAASITGFLGPDGEHLGRVFISVFKRGSTKGVTVELDIQPLLTQNLRTRPRKRRTISEVEKRLFRRELASIAAVFLVRSSLDI